MAAFLTDGYQTALYHSFRDAEGAGQAILELSRISSVLLLLVYIIYLFFHLRSHAHLAGPVPPRVTRTRLDSACQVQQNYTNGSPMMSTRSSSPTAIELIDRDARITSSSSSPGKENVVKTWPVQGSHGTAAQDYETSWCGSSTLCSQERVKCSEYLPVAGTAPRLQTVPSIRQSPSEEGSASLADLEQSRHHRRTSTLPVISRNAFYQPSDFLATRSSSACTIGRLASLVLLLVSSILVSISAFFLTNTIDAMVANTPLSEAFIGIILLPIAGNAAEHITAMTVASKNKMDLAIGVSVGSSIQIALFVTPAVVLLGWSMERQMTLYFSFFETVTLVVAVGLVVVVMLNGRTNYLEGSLLCVCYIMVG